jgi:hypothetical protein
VVAHGGAARGTIEVLEIEVTHWKKKPETIVGAQTGKLYKQNYFFGAASPVRGHSAPDDWL